MRIIVDAFGGDHAPGEILRGGAAAAAAYGHEVVLVGDAARIRQTAAELGVSLAGLELAHAPGVIGMEDDPRSILKENEGCSMAEGLRLLRDGRGDAFVSAGSTGALIMGATFLVKRIRGISRAALAPIMPGERNPFMLLDAGANTECRPEMLLQFAQMGSAYMSRVMNDGQPARVGLLNIGTEETKGGDLQREAFALLRESGLNFTGNIEARDVPFGGADVVVADGFNGNVLLKTMEGTADVMLSNIKRIFMHSALTKAAALLVKGQIGAFRRRMDTAQYGGAPLLGIAKPVIKAHGNSKAAAVQSAIRVAAEFAAAGVIEEIAAGAKAE